MTKKAIRRAATAGALALGLLPIGAVAAPPTPATAHAGYVGTVSGSRAFVAVVVNGGSVTAYVCDSHSVARWFRGTVHGGRATLESTTGDSVLAVTVAQRRATGTVRLAGVTHSFSATPDDGEAGLYRGTRTAAGQRYLGGWIILPDGRQRGAVVSGSTVVASPTLNPNDLTVDVKPKDMPKHVVIAIIAILIG